MISIVNPGETNVAAAAISKDPPATAELMEESFERRKCRKTLPGSVREPKLKAKNQ
jgi:hypothetical protein